MTFCFVCSHLAAHRKDVEARNRDWNNTNENMRFELRLDNMMHGYMSRRKKEEEMTMWEFAAARFSEMPYSNGKDSRYEYIKAKIRERWGHKSINKSNKSRLKALAINRGIIKRSSSLTNVVRKFSDLESLPQPLNSGSLDLSISEELITSPLPPSNRSISLGARHVSSSSPSSLSKSSLSMLKTNNASLGSIELAIEDHDLIFWFGDLNYRIGMEMNIEDVFEKLDDNSIGSLRHLFKYDQLNNERQKDNVFVGYEEGEILFKPTYKYVISSLSLSLSLSLTHTHTHVLDTHPIINRYGKHTVTYDRGQGNKEGKIRVPAWCDRVLWRKTLRAHALVRQIHYDRETYMMSDHMPVVAVFEVGVKNRMDEERVARRKRMDGVLGDRTSSDHHIDRIPRSALLTNNNNNSKHIRGHFRSNSKVIEDITSVRTTTIYFNIQVARKSQDMKRFLKMQSAIHSMLNRLDLMFLRHGIANMCRLVPLPVLRLDNDVTFSGTLLFLSSHIPPTYIIVRLHFTHSTNSNSNVQVPRQQRKVE